MPWVKLDDGFPAHPKVARLSDAAFRLYVSSLAYCARYLTDGVVPGPVVASLCPKNPTDRAGELVRQGLWARTDGDYRIHDYHDYNPTADDVRAQRDQRAEAGRRGGQAKGKAKRKQTASDSSSNTSSKTASKTEAESNPVPVPSPSATDVASFPSGRASAPAPQSEPNGNATDTQRLVIAYDEYYRRTHADRPAPKRLRAQAGRAAKELLAEGQPFDDLDRCLAAIAKENKSPTNLALVLGDMHSTKEHA